VRPHAEIKRSAVACASGNGAIAAGNGSLAVGAGPSAYNGGLAIGVGTVACGPLSQARGINAVAIGHDSLSIGITSEIAAIGHFARDGERTAKDLDLHIRESCGASVSREARQKIVSKAAAMPLRER